MTGGPSIAAPAWRAAAAPRSERLIVRGLSCHVRRWGDPTAPALLMLHGARDCAATFQFVVEAFARPWNIAAPDWRGHGLSAHTHGDYWVHDFLADLEALADALFPDCAFDLVGHSMGGNIGSLYAGLWPHRVRRFVTLDALGPPAHRLPVDIRATLAGRRGAAPSGPPRGYASLEEVADRLRRANTRLTATRAAYLARHSTTCGADGRYRWLYDARFERSLPTLRTIEEWASIWAGAQAPTLWIASSDQRKGAPFFDEATAAQRLALHPCAQFHRLEGTGHNLHHDRPELVARLIEDFLAGSTRGDRDQASI